MTLQTSGSISFADLQTEFGGSNPISLDEYYRGGSYVFPSTMAGSGSFQTVPLTPSSSVLISEAPNAIQLSQFYGSKKKILGDTGLIYAKSSADVNQYQEFTLPAGVDLITFNLLGGGGGAGGWDDGLTNGGNGGAGVFMSGTISTVEAFGAAQALQDRTLVVYVGHGGDGGWDGGGDQATSVLTPPATKMGYQMRSTSIANWKWQRTTVGSVMSDDIGGYARTNYNRPMRQMLYFPSTGSYLFEFTADNHAEIQIDGTQVAHTWTNNDQGNTNDSYTLTSPLTRTVTIQEGYHCLSILLLNSGSISGVALRITEVATSTVIWKTDDAASGSSLYYVPAPIGGAGGVAGVLNTSGYGGAGGSATSLFIRFSGNPYLYPLAVAGGGGGGGGGGTVLYGNGYFAVWKNGNWCNQGLERSVNPVLIAGDTGESRNRENREDGTYDEGATDGGGGGGGGGGVLNNRMYYAGSRLWQYSGFGGRGPRNYPAAKGVNELAGSGGESGKSFLTSLCTTMTDFFHGVSNSYVPIIPSSVPGAFTSYGHGAIKGLTASAGDAGLAFVSWGYENGSTSPTATYTPVTCHLVPFTGTIGDSNSQGGTMDFVVDAFGGGGRPGSEYTYRWTITITTSDGPTSATLLRQSGGRATFRVVWTPGSLGQPGPWTDVSEGLVTCVATDSQGSSGTSEGIQWYWEYTDLGSGDTGA